MTQETPSPNKTMRAIQVAAPGAPMELVEIPIPQPGDGQVLIKVEACGVCHGDAMVAQGSASAYPRIPGHEVVGVVERCGDQVTGFAPGERVGIGWHGGNGNTTGLTMDGGYAEFMIANADGLIHLPEELASAEAAPLLCAGETVFSALKNSAARMGDLVAVSGIGGLGHLALQYAHKAGFEVVAISHGSEKKELAMGLGAQHYIDSSQTDVAQALQDLGGADVIIATAPVVKALEPLPGGLKPGGELILAAVSEEPLDWSAMTFLTPLTVKGTFTSKDMMESAIKFSALTHVTPLIETFPLEQAPEAFQKMMDATVHFRAVLVP